MVVRKTRKIPEDNELIVAEPVNSPALATDSLVDRVGVDIALAVPQVLHEPCRRVAQRGGNRCADAARLDL